MSVETPPQPRTTREPPPRVGSHSAPSKGGRFLQAVAVGLVAVVLAALISVWPALTLIGLGLILIVTLVFVAPPYALVGAILVYGLEGAIKVGIAREFPRVGVTPEAIGAAVMDFVFLAALLGILRQDRGRTLLAIWRNVGRPVRIALALLAGWIAISLAQLALSGDIDAALAGFRLSQAYVLAVLAGGMLLAGSRPQHVVNALVAVLLVITAYAAFRAVAGPSETERAAAFARSTTALVPSEDGVIYRNSGSFSSAIGLASYLVPAGVFLFALGLAFVRLRLATWFGVALVVVALVGSYVRTSLVAVAGGVLCAAALLTFTGSLTRRTKIVLGLAAVPLLVLLIGLGAVLPNAVSGGSQAVQQRSGGLLDPLSDPSLTTRVDRWRESLDEVQAHPLGSGLGTVGSATRDREGRVQAFADNSYLKVLQEQGPLGAIPFILGIFGLLITIALRIRQTAMPFRGLGIAAVTAATAFFLLAWTSEAIEQPGKVLTWLLVGLALWAAAAMPERDPGRNGHRAGETDVGARGVLGALPRWTRSRYALLIALLLVAVPVAVSLARDPHFSTTLEVFPTSPPGNVGGSSDDLPAVRAVVANPGFQFGTQGWQAPPGSVLSRSSDQAFSGSGALASIYQRRPARDWRIASSRAVLPSAGRYGVQAWVRLPSDYSGGRPAVELEGFSQSRRVAARTGDPALRGQWQLISADYVVDPQDTRGRIVLRTGSALPAPGQVLHWDDVRVRSNDVNLPAPDEVNLVVNPSFENDRSGWGGGAQFDGVRSDRLAHTGGASLRSSTAERAPADTNAAHTYVVFPRPGTYRVKAWVYVPPKQRGGSPAVFLEGFLGSTQLVQTLGDPARRGAWQWVATDYVISPQDLEGSLVLRDLPSSAPGSRAPGVGPERVVYWDDVSVTVPRSDPRNATVAAAGLRATLAEPQLRSDVARITAADNLYDPRRATVERSPRDGTLSFFVKVKNAVPNDANRLAQPLRQTLLDAARRGTRRQAAKRWQGLIASVGEGLTPRQRALLNRRAEVMEHLIGAQPADVVAPPPPPAPAPAADPAARAAAQARAIKAHEDQQGIISRIGEDLPPWQRALVQQQADNLQRMIAADTAGFVVLPPTASVEPTRRVDRLLDDLPAPYPTRVGTMSAVVAGLICCLLLLGMLITATAARRRPAATGH